MNWNFKVAISTNNSNPKGTLTILVSHMSVMWPTTCNDQHLYSVFQSFLSQIKLTCIVFMILTDTDVARKKLTFIVFWVHFYHR